MSSPSSVVYLACLDRERRGGGVAREDALINNEKSHNNTEASLRAMDITLWALVRRSEGGVLQIKMLCYRADATREKKLPILIPIVEGRAEVCCPMDKLVRSTNYQLHEKCLDAPRGSQ